VFDSPSSATVAKLLGFRNTFQGRILSSTPEGSVIKYQNFSLCAPAGSLLPGTVVDFFVNPRALSVLHSGYTGSLPPGTILGGVIDTIWPRMSGSRLAVIVGNGISSDCWEVEEIHSRRLPKQREQEPVRLFLPQTSIHVMGQDEKILRSSIV